MSRRGLLAKVEYFDLWVGWDPGGGTFFLQYGDLNDDKPLMLHAGYRPGEYPVPDLIIALARHFGEDELNDLGRLLLADKEAEGCFYELDQDAPEVSVASRGRAGIREIGTMDAATALANPDRFVSLAETFMNVKWAEWHAGDNDAPSGAP